MWNSNAKNCYQQWTVQYWVLRHKALSVWEEDPANNKGTGGLPTHRHAFNFACLMVVMRYVRCVTWFDRTWICRNSRRSTIVVTSLLMPSWCHLQPSLWHCWVVRFTHNGHHHCKKTSLPAIKKLRGCRPADISTALFFNGCVMQ